MTQSLGHILTTYYKDEMIIEMKAIPQLFDELVQLALSNTLSLNPCVTWLLSHIIEPNDARRREHVPSLLEALKTAQVSKRRDLINVLRQMEISKDNEGTAFDTCAEIWAKIAYMPSVRFDAFRLLIKIAEKHPELSGEVLS